LAAAGSVPNPVRMQAADAAANIRWRMGELRGWDRGMNAALMRTFLLSGIADGGRTVDCS
jgi:hypothetical protein